MRFSLFIFVLLLSTAVLPAQEQTSQPQSVAQYQQIQPQPQSQPTQPQQAPQTTESWYALKQLKKIYLDVPPLETEQKQIGLVQKTLETKTQLKLRQFGIPIVPKNQSQATLSLVISTRTYKEVGFFPIIIKLSLLQPARLYHNEEIILPVTTWQQEAYGITDAQHCKTFVEKSVDALLEFFINDYLTANPLPTAN